MFVVTSINIDVDLYCYVDSHFTNAMNSDGAVRILQAVLQNSFNGY